MVPAGTKRELDHRDGFHAFNAVMVYDDVRAGQLAFGTLAALVAELEGEMVELRLQLWRFGLLEDPAWFARSLGDVISADMLVLSTSRPSGWSAAVERWLKLCLTRKRGTRAAVVALLGLGTELDDRACLRLRFLQSAARDAGLDFYAPGLPTQGSSGLNPSNRSSFFPIADEVSGRIEPVQHWGINE